LKLVYVVIDGLGDLPVPELGGETPLGAADTPNMDSLSKSGKTGMMYTVGRGIAPESDVGVISILGYDPFKYATGRGVVEALGSGMKMRDGDLALRCNFATLGQGVAIVDRRAGRDLTTVEAKKLAATVQNSVKLTSSPTDFDFRATIGHRAVLVMRSKKGQLSSKVTNTDPAYTRVEDLGVAKKEPKMVLQKCQPMDNSPEARVAADLVNEFTEKSHRVLDKDEVNEKRAQTGKLKANVILCRDAGHLLPHFFNINERYGVRFACFADMPVERGIARLVGMHLVDLPPPSKDINDDLRCRVSKLVAVLPRYDCFYIHIKGPDEPGHDGDFRLKTQLIAAIDKHFFGELLPRIDLKEYVVCVTADHATPCRLKAHSDDPVPVVVAGDKIQGDNALEFSEKECAKGSLGVLEHGYELMPRLVGYLNPSVALRKA
jgi:2,3-bisphosphoglycerate-independent phosphoglycerate mutase